MPEFRPSSPTEFNVPGATVGTSSDITWNTGIGGTPIELARNVYPRLLDIVREVQQKLGYQILVTSGKRTTDLNQEVGGREGSAHLDGLALDLWVPPEKETELYSAVRQYEPELRELVYEINPRHLHISYKQENAGMVGVAPDENFKATSIADGVYYTPKTVGIGPRKYEIVGIEQLREDPDFADDAEAASRPGAFKIGATFLTIPPTSIEVSEMNNLYQIPTLRTHGSPYTKDGRSTLTIDLDMTFTDVNELNDKLRHVIAQFRRSPFLPIENYFLQSILYPDVHPIEPLPTAPHEKYSDAFRGEDGTFEQTQQEDKDKWLSRQKRLDDAISSASPSDTNKLIMDIESRGRAEQESEADFRRRIENLRRIPEYLQKYQRIRSSIAGISFQDQPIVVALRQITVSTVPGYPRSMSCHLTCDLFNYLPYTHTYAFSKDIGTETPVFNISKSKVFQRYYRGLLSSGGRPEFPDAYPSIQTHMEALPDSDIEPFSLRYVFLEADRNEALESITMIQRYAEMARLAKSTLNAKDNNVILARGLLKSIDTFLKSPLFTGWVDITSDVAKGSYQYIENVAKTVPQIWTSIRSVWKLPKRLLGGDMYAFLDNDETIYITRNKNNIPIIQSLDDYLEEVTADKEPQLLELRTMARSLAEYEFDQSLLDDTFDVLHFGVAGPESNTITAINCSYKPKLVPIQLMSYVTPTYQHMGSSEWTITVNIQTNSPSFVQKLRLMNQRMNKLSLRRNRGAQYSNLLYLDNTARILSGPMFAFFGIEHVMPGNFRYSTVEGKPGMTNISIDFVQTDISVRQYEKLSSPHFFSYLLLSQVLRKLQDGFTSDIKRLHDAISIDFNREDQYAIQEWRGGYREGIFDPKVSRRWNKLLYNLSKPIPRALFDGQSASDYPPVIEFLMNQLSDRPSPEEGMKRGRELLGASPAGIMNKVEGFVESIYRSRAEQLVKELLSDALAYDTIPDSIKRALGETLLKEIEIERKAFSEPASTYPDLEIPEIPLAGQRLPPAFFFYQPEFYDLEKVEADAIDLANATHSLSLTIAELNGVNFAGEATRSATGGQNLVHVALTDVRIRKMIESAKRVIELKKELAEQQVRRKEQFIANSESRRLEAQIQAVEREKRYWEELLPGLEGQIGLIDLINRQEDSSKALRIQNRIAKSWGVITDEERAINKRILLDSIEAQDDKTLSLGRAFPTFKLYFIEKDKAEWIMFDDFYSYGAVKSIRIHSSRKSASSTAVIELSNISNTLNDVMAQNPESPLRGGTTDEQNVDSLMLRVGCEIMIRMGYDSTPENLPIVFQGAIASIEPGELMTLTAQSWGAELTYPIGAGNEFTVGATSMIKEFGDLASAIISEVPGLLHFGTTYNLAEMMDVTPGDRSYDDLKAGWWAKLRNEGLGMLGWGPMIDHRMDNIWLPFNSVPGVGLNSILREVLGGKGTGFDWVIRSKSAWESLEEILHYFPGYIMKVLPYNEKDTAHARSTLYIGPSTGYYEAEDDAEHVDVARMNALEKYVQGKREWFASIRSQRFETQDELKDFLSDKGVDLSQEVFQDAYKALLRQDGGWFLDLSMLQTALYVTDPGLSHSYVGWIAGLYLGLAGGLGIRPKVLDGRWAPMYPVEGGASRIERETARKWHYINIDSDLSFDGLFDVYDIYDILHVEEYEKLTGSTFKALYKNEAFTIKPENPSDLMKDGNPPRGYRRACRAHFADSYHHIMQNSIVASAEFANKIILSFPQGEPTAHQSSTFVPSDDVKRVELYVDDNIRLDLVRAKEIFEPNIDIDRWSRYQANIKRIRDIVWNTISSLFTSGDGTDNASRVLHDIPVEYTVGNVHLGEELKKMYSGEITLLLNPKIQVHDTLYIHDDVNQMYGPVGVREVQHVFDSELGAFTIVVPDLHSYVGDMTPTLQTIYASKIMNAAVKLSLIPLTGGVGLGAASFFLGHPVIGAGVAGAGMYGAYKVGSTILLSGYGDLLGRQCGRFVPLWYKGQPFVAGVEGMRKDDYLVHIQGKISRLGDVWKNLGSLANPKLVFPSV